MTVWNIQIENDELRTSHIPPLDDYHAFLKFVHSYNVYTRFGWNRGQLYQFQRPFKQKFIEEGRIEPEVILTQLRICLFGEWRLWRLHSQDLHELNQFFSDQYILSHHPLVFHVPSPVSLRSPPPPQRTGEGAGGGDVRGFLLTIGLALVDAIRRKIELEDLE